MKSLNLGKLLKAAQRAVRRDQYDHLPDGRIHVPRAGAFIGGAFTARYAPPGGEFGGVVVASNRVVTQGLVKLLNLLGGHASAAPLYIAPYINNVDPPADWSGATFAGAAGEFTAYAPSTRLPWTTVALTTTPNLSNAAALAAATLTFNTGGPYTIRGAALLEASAKEATTGSLIVASPFSDPLTGMMGGGKLALEYGIVAMDEEDA